MTRKCALCKGTNYKRTYSFFSAPKDPEIRKKWQAIIPIPSYTVTDETYICSKHFKGTDIITHWVSGVPPHVVKIKYKKCRLRVGAVPCLNLEDNDIVPKTLMLDQAGRRDQVLADEMDFLIAREKPIEFVAVNSQVRELNYDDSDGTIEPRNRFKKYTIVSDQNNAHFDHTKYVSDSSPYKTYILHDKQIRDSGVLAENNGFDHSGHYFDYNYPQIRKIEGHASIIDEELQENLDNNDDGKLQDDRIHRDVCPEEMLLSHNMKMEQDFKMLNEELVIEDDVSARLHKECITDTDGENRDNTSENNHEITKRQELGERILKVMQYEAGNKSGKGNPASELCDTMLFEDLLEIYTEVTLPRGWAFLVTSKGHATTVVYLYMNMPRNDIPVVEKEVYIKSDMIMHCGVGNREINPILHNLIKDGRNNKVHALSDIEELIDELDQRHICEGGPNVKNFQDIEIQVAYVDGMKWRHIGCPIIINNGSSKCSKCMGLTSVVTRKKNGNTSGQSSDMFRKKQKKIESLKKSMKKITRQNKRLEKIRLNFKHRFKVLLADSEENIKNRICSSNMPEIQKLMITECLKTSLYKNKNNARCSETWIFLCLLLYVESPRMYRYMFVNNYMTLPSMGIIRKYLHQIKTDPQFYNLFQRSVEPYQPVGERDEEEPT